MKNDVTNIGNGTNNSVLNVSLFDDLISPLTSSLGFCGGSASSFSEQNHPGIVTVGSSTSGPLDAEFFGSTTFFNPSTQTLSYGGISMTNDFSIDLLYKLSYGVTSGTGAGTIKTGIYQEGSLKDTSITYSFVAAGGVVTSTTSTMSKDNGSSPITNPQTFPAPESWVTIRFEKVGSNITIKQDGGIVGTIAVTGTPNFGILGIATESSGNCYFNAGIDYVKIDYQVIR